MGSNIFNFDLETEGNQSTVIDLENGYFTEDKNKKIMYHFPSSDTKSTDKILTITDNNTIIYKEIPVGVISFPKSCSINISKLPDIEIIIKEEC